MMICEKQRLELLAKNNEIASIGRFGGKKNNWTKRTSFGWTAML